MNFYDQKEQELDSLYELRDSLEFQLSGNTDKAARKSLRNSWETVCDRIMNCHDEIINWLTKEIAKQKKD
jgi:hypothetical protein